MAETKTKIPVQIRICIKKRKIGKAALASTTKKRALRAESRQWAVAEKFSAMLTSVQRLQLPSIEVYRAG